MRRIGKEEGSTLYQKLYDSTTGIIIKMRELYAHRSVRRVQSWSLPLIPKPCVCNLFFYYVTCYYNIYN